MPDARRLLAKMSAGAQNLQFGTGAGVGALNQMDISLAAGRIKKPLTYLWVVYRYGGHDGQKTIRKLETAIVLELSKWAVQERWRMRGGGLGKDRLRRVARLWIAEASHPRRCPQCKGSGQWFNVEQKRHVGCPRCGGDGITGWSNLKRAQWLGIRHSAWQKTWLRRYERLNEMMKALEGNGMRVVSAFLSDPLD